MTRRHTYAAVLAAGLLTALGSAVAAADPSTTTAQQPTISTEPGPPPGPMTVSPRSGRVGQAVTLRFVAVCDNRPTFSTTVLTIGAQESYPSNYELEASATVNSDAKPGTYSVLASCSRHGFPRAWATSFTVLGNSTATPPGHQVKQVPTGAAQTGGGGTALQN